MRCMGSLDQYTLCLAEGAVAHSRSLSGDEYIKLSTCLSDVRPLLQREIADRLAPDDCVLQVKNFALHLRISHSEKLITLLDFERQW